MYTDRQKVAAQHVLTAQIKLGAAGWRAVCCVRDACTAACRGRTVSNDVAHHAGRQSITTELPQNAGRINGRRSRRLDVIAGYSSASSHRSRCAQSLKLMQRHSYWWQIIASENHNSSFTFRRLTIGHWLGRRILMLILISHSSFMCCSLLQSISKTLETERLLYYNINSKIHFTTDNFRLQIFLLITVVHSLTNDIGETLRIHSY